LKREKGGVVPSVGLGGDRAFFVRRLIEINCNEDWS